jgi:hypothetical protein
MPVLDHHLSPVRLGCPSRDGTVCKAMNHRLGGIFAVALLALVLVEPLHAVTKGRLFPKDVAQCLKAQSSVSRVFVFKGVLHVTVGGTTTTLTFYTNGPAASSALRRMRTVASSLETNLPTSIAYAERDVVVDWGATPRNSDRRVVAGCLR